MSGTSIKRKERKNKVKSKKRQEAVKRLTKKPVLKNIDIESIKEEFNKKSKAEKPSGDKPSKTEEVKKAEDKKTEKTDQTKPQGVAVGEEKSDIVKSEKEAIPPTETQEVSAPELEKKKKVKGREEGKSAK